MRNTNESGAAGGERSEPLTYHSYEKIAVLLCMYVSVYVALVLAIRRPRARHAIAHVQARGEPKR